MVDRGETLHCFARDSRRLAPTGSGALSDKTFVAKDLFAIAGHRSSFGLARWRDTHAASDTTAEALERLTAAGAELIGLTKLDQLAYSLVGNAGEGEPPLNSLYRDRFTGGSSSGAASAVAGGLCDFAIGTDTAGSIRVPAAACGLFSIRPTHGLLSTAGVLPLAPSFDVVGMLAGEPSILRAALAAAAAEPIEARPLQSILLPSDCLTDVHPEVSACTEELADLLAARLDVPVHEVPFARFTSESVADLFARIQAREVWGAHGEWARANEDCLAADVRLRLQRAMRLAAAPEEEQAADAAEWERYRSDFDGVVGDRVAVVLPVMSGLPPLRSASEQELQAFRIRSFRWTAPSSLTGSPQAVLPVRDRASGRTYGVGVLGARHSDTSILAALESSVAR